MRAACSVIAGPSGCTGSAGASGASFSCLVAKSLGFHDQDFEYSIEAVAYQYVYEFMHL